jgi:hypothetical protein
MLVLPDTIDQTCPVPGSFQPGVSAAITGIALEQYLDVISSAGEHREHRE